MGRRIHNVDTPTILIKYGLPVIHQPILITKAVTLMSDTGGAPMSPNANIEREGDTEKDGEQVR